jgi:hypothetical protein
MCLNLEANMLEENETVTERMSALLVTTTDPYPSITIVAEAHINKSYHPIQPKVCQTFFTTLSHK